jgi:hypothetical protein
VVPPAYSLEVVDNTRGVGVSAAGSWTDEELRRVGDAVELDLAVRRRDGQLRPYTTMWVVRVGDDLYVRSAGGPDRPWYRHALASGTGRLRAGGIERDVRFGDADPDIHDSVDSAYHAKYDRFGPGPVSHVTGPDARTVTIRLVRSET